MEKHLYIISGLGADERVFRNLRFPEYRVHFLKWLVPEKGETLENYARRMSDQIDSARPILIGMSFGGIMAAEIARHIEVRRIILISSVKERRELPPLFRFVGKFGIHRLIPVRLFTWSNPLTNWLFGTQGREEERLLAAVMKDTHLGYLKWAIDKILLWKNETRASHLTHIHGTADRLLPFRYITDAIAVKGGGHLMILNKAEEVGRMINELLVEESSR